MKLKVVTNVEDTKDAGGLWIRSYCPEPYVQHRTRAEVVWGYIRERTNPNSKYQKESTAYHNCTNDFKDFQEFAEWCQGEYGYWNKEMNGNFWSIDKDILSISSSKSY